MAYDLGIKINLIDSDIVKIENTIKKRMNEISNKYKIKLSIENKSINDVEKQLEKVKTALEKTTINLDGNLNIDSIMQFFSEIDIGISELETKRVNLIDSTQVMLIREVREGLLETSNNMVSLKGNIEQVTLLMNSTKTTVKDIEKAIKNASESVDGSISGELTKSISSMGEDITSEGLEELKDKITSIVSPSVSASILGAFGVAATATSFSVIALSSALTVGLGVAISVAMVGITKLINKNKELRESVENTIKTTRENISDNINNIQMLSDIKDEYGTLYRKNNRSFEEEERYLELNNKIAQISPELVSGYDAQGNAILNLKGNVDGLIESLKEKNRIENLKVVADWDNIVKVNKDKKKELEDGKEYKEALASRERLNKQIPYNKKIKSDELQRGNHLINFDKGILELEQELAQANATIEITESQIKALESETSQLNISLLQSAKGFDELTSSQKNLAGTLAEKNTDFNPVEADKIINKLKLASTEFEQLDNLKMNKSKMSVRDFKKEVDSLIEKIHEVTEIPIDTIKDNYIGYSNINGAKDTVQYTKELIENYENVGKEVRQIDSILNEHAETNQWNKEALIELAKEYPYLLDLLGNEEALEKALIKTKNDRINKAKEVYNKDLSNAGDYLKKLTSGYEADATNFKTAQEAKLYYADEVRKRLDERNAGFKSSKDSILKESMEISKKLKTTKDEKEREKLKERDEELREKYKFVEKDQVATNSLYSSSLGSIDSAIDDYYPLKNMKFSFNFDPQPSTRTLESPKKNIEPRKEIFQTNFPELDKYKIKIDRANEELEKQEKIIDKLNKQRKKYSENNDSNNELKTIQQLTKEYDKLIKILKSEQKGLANTKESIKKDFFNLTKIDISKYSKAQLDVIYAERYGGLREYKDEKSKKAAEDDEKKFKLFVDAWFNTDSAIEKIDNELYEAESERLKNIEEYWESVLKIRDKNLEKSKNDLEDARANSEVIESIYNDRTGYDKKIEAIEEIINATQVYKVKLIEENAYLQAQLLTLKEGSKEWEDINNRIRENDKEIRNSSKSLAEYSDKKKEIEVSKLNAVKDIEEKIINLLKEKYKVVQEKEEDRHRTALENIEEERKAFNEYIDEKIKALDKEEKKENYNKELNKKLEEKAKLQKQLDALMLDSSLESKAKQEELLEQLKNKQEEIEEFQNKYALDLKKENLQEQKEAHNKALDDKKKKEDENFENYKKALDRQLEYDKLYDEARRILVNGFYTDAIGNVVNLSEALLEYEDKFGEGLSAVGTKIKTEIIETLLEVQDLLANGFNGTILSGDNYIGPIGSSNETIIGDGNSNANNNKNKKQTITIFGNSIDLANAQILASKHGINAQFENVANTNKMPNANDIVLGQAANNYSNSTGAIKLTGKNREETKTMLEAHFESVKGSYADGGIANFAGLAMMHGTEDRPELVLNNSQASSLFNFVKNIDSGVTIRHNAINPMRSIPYGEQITNNSTIKIDKLIEINGDVDEKVLPQIEQGTLNSLNMLKRELNKSGVFSRR